ncbi:MAG: hypothetical protein MJA27_29020 [Pseudanabaenales cyanobacterium]|nr:hypothetical protein [Pseudanabaenales cyanobacterium]
MNSVQVSIVPFNCRFCNLTILAQDSNGATPDTILKEEQPFLLRASVEFVGSGAIALLCLTPSIQIDYYAKPCGRGEAIDLGAVAISAVADQFTYTPTLEVGAPVSVGLTPGTLYRISALLRVGAPNCPALICGVIEDLMVEIYTSSKLAKKSIKSKS